MSRPHLVRTTVVAAVALLLTLLTLLAAPVASAARDTTPPTAPRVNYAQGFYCLTLIIGAARATDDVTPQSQLRYDVIADGVTIGQLADRGSESGAWAVLQLPHQGPNTVSVRAIDAAGNRSAASNSYTVTGFFTPGCVPGRIG